MAKLKLYSIDLRVYATAYIKAKSKRAAMEAVRSMIGDDASDYISEADFDETLPDLSLSPAMTIHGIDRGQRLELVQEEIEETEDDD